MAIVQTVPKSFMTELFTAVHDFSSDTFKIALYDSAAALDGDTTVYSTTNEVSGTGYVAGGATIAVASGFPKIASEGVWNKLIVDFDDPSWAGATITASAALIYNSSKANRAVCVIDLGGSVSAAAETLTIVLPPGDFYSALMQMAASTSGR